jgi:hypothetical protein
VVLSFYYLLNLPCSSFFRLAEQASIDGFEFMTKSQLYSRLKEQYNFDRLLRAEVRSRKILREGCKSSSSASDTEGDKKRKLSITVEDEEQETELEPTTPQRSSVSSSSASASKSTKKSKKLRKQSSSSSSSLNFVDPVMLLPIDKKKKPFQYTRTNGVVVQFNVETLIDFLISSGDFTDPETRLPFNDEQLKAIDSVAKVNGLIRPSVYEAKNNLSFYSEKKFRRDALLGLERCAGEVITDMLNLIENADPDVAQMQLAMSGLLSFFFFFFVVFFFLFCCFSVEFPSFVDYFRQIREVDSEYASKCIAHWKLFLVGPPNRPNDDEYGIMKVFICLIFFTFVSSSFFN